MIRNLGLMQRTLGQIEGQNNLSVKHDPMALRKIWGQQCIDGLEKNKIGSELPIFFNFHFILEYSWLTILCQFQVYSIVIQLCVCVCVCIWSFSDSFPIQIITKYKQSSLCCTVGPCFLVFFNIYLFLAVLGLRFCARAFSSCGKRGPLLIAVRGPLTVAASPVVGHRLQTRRLSSCGSRVQLLRGMWDLPRPGLEPVSPALAGRFSTTAPPGKPEVLVDYLFYIWYYVYVNPKS